MRLIEELKMKFPAMATRAERSPLAAIRLFCLECMGGSRSETAGCTTLECSLHPFRKGHRPPGVLPEVDEEPQDAAQDLEEGES